MLKWLDKKLLKYIKYCKKCGKELVTSTVIESYNSVTGKPNKIKIIVKCPEFYTNSLDDNGHFYVSYTEKVKNETD